ncbi:MAG: flagellar basal body P-ring protein FlgI, partial [Sedimentisphaerales bacterium]
MFTKSNRRKMLWCIALVPLVLTFGCGGSGRSQSKTRPSGEINDLGPTIGTLAEIFASDSIPVRGYGLVGGLNGTGSSECPPDIRAYLEKYILQRLSNTKVNIDELISSPDTAVVVVDGIIPPAASANQRFDVRVTALPSTQTTSLEGGWLYGADLEEARQFGNSIKSLAIAEGPVYLDVLDPNTADARAGYILGGGLVSDDYKVNLTLRRPDYRVVSQIRNRINERFGYETAVALAPGSIELHVPTKYAAEKDRFIQLVRATYLVETPELVEKRIIANIQKLANSQNKHAAEITLEAIGNVGLPKLAALLNSSDAEVRMRAARCMLNLGDNRGRDVLWNIASDKTSPYRIEAVNAIAVAATKQDTSSLLRGLLRDDDFSVRFIACENLIRLNDVSVSEKLIANSIYLDQIPGTPGQSGKPAILVSRQGQPRIILLGAPIYCRGDVFIESPDGTITINAPAGQRSATIIRKHPRRPDIIIHLQSSLDLADIIQTLCKEPVTRPAEGRPGLGVS